MIQHIIACLQYFANKTIVGSSSDPSWEATQIKSIFSENWIKFQLGSLLNFNRYFSWLWSAPLLEGIFRIEKSIAQARSLQFRSSRTIPMSRAQAQLTEIVKTRQNQALVEPNFQQTRIRSAFLRTIWRSPKQVFLIEAQAEMSQSVSLFWLRWTAILLFIWALWIVYGMKIISILGKRCNFITDLYCMRLSFSIDANLLNILP